MCYLVSQSYREVRLLQSFRHFLLVGRRPSPPGGLGQPAEVAALFALWNEVKPAYNVHRASKGANGPTLWQANGPDLARVAQGVLQLDDGHVCQNLLLLIVGQVGGVGSPVLDL